MAVGWFQMDRRALERPYQHARQALIPRRAVHAVFSFTGWLSLSIGRSTSWARAKFSGKSLSAQDRPVMSSNLKLLAGTASSGSRKTSSYYHVRPAGVHMCPHRVLS